MAKFFILFFIIFSFSYSTPKKHEEPDSSVSTSVSSMLKDNELANSLTFEYPSASWNTHKIDIYEYDVLKFKDSFKVSMKTFHPPIKGRITSHFGFRGIRYHYGTDIKLQTGDSVYAAFDGTVRVCRYDRGGYGYFIVISHDNGLESLYGHLSKIKAKPGQKVKAGDFIAFGGNTGRSTGSHLHFELRFLGEQFDTYQFYDYEKDSLKQDYIVVNQKLFNYLKELRKAVYVRVRNGDSLWAISRRYHVSVSYLCRLNHISRNRPIYPGQKLRIR